ncbi:DsrE/DsrF-like family protein [mine drainage metagenome]|uniref:DsrE/DsrF-like family protein n=1 Tax=mine drainage metagenome TaxID=410659 RepID=A0A1J5PZ98_9ZZZZ
MPKKINTASITIAGLFVLSLHGMSSSAFAETGATATENTRPPMQIVNQTGLKVVVQVNAADTAPNGVSKQVMATRILYDQYTALGMKPGRDFEIVMVFRADGAQFLLTDEAYEQKVKQPHPKGNPNRLMLDELTKGGVKVYECGTAMRLKGYSAQDILPYSQIVVTGIGSMVDFQKSGFVAITP